MINNNSRSWFCILIFSNPFNLVLSNDLKRSRHPEWLSARPDNWRCHLAGRTTEPGEVEASWGRGQQSCTAPGQGPQVPDQAPPQTTRPKEKPRRSAAARNRPGPSPSRGGAPLQTAGNVQRLRDPRPATPTPLTHRPSSCSASFTLKLRPQHPTLPAPSLTHFPADPTPSITPAPPPPPPPEARPRPGAEGACGSCRRDRGKAGGGGGRHFWRRARCIVGVVVQLWRERRCCAKGRSGLMESYIL